MEPVGIDVNLADGKYCVISDGTTVTFPKPLKAAREGALKKTVKLATPIDPLIKPLPAKLKRLQYRNRNKQLGNKKAGQQK